MIVPAMQDGENSSGVIGAVYLLTSGWEPADCAGIHIVDVFDSMGGAVDVIRILLAILLPPLGVFLQVGFGLHFWLNILLTLLGYIPGIIHAVWVITRK